MDNQNDPASVGPLASPRTPANPHASANSNGDGEAPEDAAIAEDEIATPVDLGRRFTNWQTPVSFLIAVTILAIALYKLHIDRGQLGNALHKINPLLYLAAFVVYYVLFPIRALRWKILMLNANTGPELEKVKRTPLKDLVEIIYLSWFANCVIPAKLGDVYRAYLLKKTEGVSASRTVGTILAERILDLVVLFPLLLAAAVLTFHKRLLDNSTLRFVMIGAFVLGVVAVAVIVSIWRLGDGLRRVLPLRIHSIFTAFREGAVDSFRANVGTLVGLSIVVWFCEAAAFSLCSPLSAWSMQARSDRAPRYFLRWAHRF